jgi:hypothetical protein
VLRDLCCMALCWLTLRSLSAGIAAMQRCVRGLFHVLLDAVRCQ